jgi:predicted GNAT family N-acyltransferase
MPSASRTRLEHVTVVRSLDGFLRAAAIRAIVYMGAQECPFDEEFDGNDFCGMHLLGWVGGEAVACLRLRFFGDFAKLERLAVLPEHRRSSIAFMIVRQALRIAARKGFRQAYGHARDGLEPFWARFGARAAGAPGAFSFSGQRYTEMLVDLPAPPDALRIGADPLVLNRPEGAWDAPGVLEPKPAQPDAPGWSGGVRSAWIAGGYGRAAGFEEASSQSYEPGPAAARRPAGRRRLRASAVNTRKAPPFPAGPRSDSASTRYQSQTRTRRITTVS